MPGAYIANVAATRDSARRTTLRDSRHAGGAFIDPDTDLAREAQGVGPKRWVLPAPV